MGVAASRSMPPCYAREAPARMGVMSDEQPDQQGGPERPEGPDPRNGSAGLEQPVQADAVAREWIAVPPAHPHTATAASNGGAPGGRGLAIAAMGVGLLAVLTTGVAAFYFNILVIAGAVLGVAAIGLGIAALMKRQSPRPASIAGLAGGSAALLGAAVVGGIMLAAWIGPDGAPEASGSSSSSSGDTSTGGEDDGEWDPDEERESLIEWPANMGTGGILFVQGADGPSVAPSAPVAAGQAPAAPSVDRDNGPADILLYVDYRCPHCVDFEEANAQTLERLVTDGAATVEIRPMAFVSAFSLDLSNAMACVVGNQPEDGWAAHLALLSRSTQQISTTANLLEELDDVTGGLSAGARSCIESGQFTTFAEALSQWYVSSPVPNAVNPNLTVRGTPLAVVNGVPYTGAPSDGAAFSAFLAEQGL